MLPSSEMAASCGPFPTARCFEREPSLVKSEADADCWLATTMLSGPRAAGTSWRAGACGGAHPISAARRIMYFMGEMWQWRYRVTTPLGRFQPISGPNYPTSVPIPRSPGDRMRTRSMVAAVLLLAAVAPASAQDSTWTWRKPMSAGQALRIKNILGDISATPANGREAEVVARIHSPSGGRSDVESEVVESAEGRTICAVYEDTNDCEPSGRTFADGERNDHVEFEVRVPRGVEFKVSTVSGDVVASGMTADVNAGSVSGNVRVETTGFAHASSVSGSVHVKMDRADWEGTLSLSSVSGDITLEVPELDATVSFNTVSGDLDSDWPITLKSSGSRRHMNGTIGRGGRKLSLTTVSG